MKRVSLRARLTLWYTGALIVAFSLFGADLWWTEGRLGVRRVDRELDGLVDTLTNVIRAEWREGQSPTAAVEEARRTVTPAGSAIAILDAHGAVLSAKGADTFLQDRPVDVPTRRTVWTTEGTHGTWRVHADAATLDQTTLVLMVAQPMADARRGQHEVLEAMQVALPLALALAGLGGFWLASVGLRPITDMAHRAEQIPATGLDDLGHAERADELGQLARAFNALIARLRAALHTQRQFMADASHELRTPVSVMRAAADVALSRPRREESEYRDALAIVSDEAQRLSRLVENMLVLARADAGGYRFRLVDLYLDEVVTECCRTLQPLSVEHQVTIRADTGSEVPFRGDEDLLRQMVLNVLQNAVQHSASGGVVGVDIAHPPGSITIRVRDSGPGISTADQARIFDRFVQLDSARRGAGTGLGLPIARWIAEAHGGSLVLAASGPDGSTFCITLPAGHDDGGSLRASRFESATHSRRSR